MEDQVHICKDHFNVNNKELNNINKEIHTEINKLRNIGDGVEQNMIFGLPEKLEQTGRSYFRKKNKNLFFAQERR